MMYLYISCNREYDIRMSQFNLIFVLISSLEFAENFIQPLACCVMLSRVEKWKILSKKIQADFRFFATQKWNY